MMSDAELRASLRASKQAANSVASSRRYAIRREADRARKNAARDDQKPAGSALPDAQMGSDAARSFA